MGVAGRLSGTVSPFRAEQGTSLETLSRARASSCQEVGTTWFFSSCGGWAQLLPCPPSPPPSQRNSPADGGKAAPYAKIAQLLSGLIKVSCRQCAVHTLCVPSSTPCSEGGHSHLVLLADFIKLKIPSKFLKGAVPMWQLQSRLWCPGWADEEIGRASCRERV